MPSGSTYPLLLATATFNPASSASVVNASVVNGTLLPECMPRDMSACPACWSAPSPFANASALSGAIVFLDLTGLPISATRVFCYSFGYQFALRAQSAGAAALLLRASSGLFQPRSKYLTPGVLNIPTFSTEFDESRLVVAGVANGTARATLPAMAGGVGPPYYPKGMSDLDASTLTVYTDRAPVAAFECAMSQSLFQPPTWAGAPAPSGGGNFSAVHYFLQGAPKPECNASETCAACITANPNGTQMLPPVYPFGVNASTPGARFTIYALSSAFPCITAFSQLTDAARAVNARALVVVMGSASDPLSLSTLIAGANYSTDVPTFGITFACYQRVAQAAAGNVSVHVSLPALYGGIAVGTEGVSAPPSGGITLGGITDANAPPAPTVASGVPYTYLLVRGAARADTRVQFVCADGAMRFSAMRFSPAGASVQWHGAVLARALQGWSDDVQPAELRVTVRAARHVRGAVAGVRLCAHVRAVRCNSRILRIALP